MIYYKNEGLIALIFSAMILYYQAFKIQIWGISVELWGYER